MKFGGLRILERNICTISRPNIKKLPEEAKVITLETLFNAGKKNQDMLLF